MSAAAAAAAAPRRRWRRRLAWTLLIAAAIRFGAPLLLPTLLDRFGRDLGLTIDYARLDLSLLGGSVELAGLEVKERAAGGDVLRVATIAVDADMSALLRGVVQFHRIEVDGVRGAITREADGTLSFGGWRLPTVAKATAVDAPATAPPPTMRQASSPSSPPPFDFTSPVAITTLRVQDVDLLVRDDAVDPRHERVAQSPAALVSLELAVSDVGSATRPTRVDLMVRAPGWCDALTVAANVRLVGADVAWSCVLDATGIVPDLVPLYVPDAGLVATARRLDLHFHSTGALAAADATAKLLRGELPELKFELRADDQLEAAVHVAGSTLALGRDQVDLDDVTTTVALRARHQAEGAIASCGFAWRPPAAAPAMAPPRAADPPTGVSPTIAPSPFRVRLGRWQPVLELQLFDDAVAPPLATWFTTRDSSIGPVELGGAAASRAPIAFELRLRELSDLVALTLQGQVSPFAPIPGGSLDLDLELPDGLVRLEPWFAALGIAPEFRDGRLTAAMSGTLASHSDGARTLDLAVGPVRFVDQANGGELLAIDSLALRDGRFAAATGGATIGELSLRGVRTAARQDEAGDWLAAGWRIAPPPGGIAPAPAGRLDLVLDDLELHLAGLALGTSATNAPPAQLDVTIALHEMVEALRLTGTVALEHPPTAVAAKLALSARGLEATRVLPLLRAHGLESALTQGELELALDARARFGDGPLRIAATVDQLRFEAGEQVLLGLDRCEVPELAVDREGVAFGAVALRGLRLPVARDEAGALHVAGLTLPGTAAPPFATELALDLAAGPGRFGSVTPLPFALTLAVADAIDALELRGSAKTAADDLAIDLAVTGRGVRAGPLAALLPPGVELAVRDGKLAAQLAARFVAPAGGARAARLDVRELSWRDGAGEPLLALARLQVDAPQLDAPTGPIVIDTVATSGLTIDAARIDATTSEIGGIRFHAAVPPATPAAAPPVAALPAAGEPPLAAPPAAALVPPPAIRLGRVEVGVDRLRFRDATRPEQPPLEASLVLRHLEPSCVWADDPAQIEPLRFELSAAAPPLVREAILALTLQPFAPQPELALSIDVRGLSGQALHDRWPELAQRLDVSGVVDGSFHAALEAFATVRRRGAVELDLGSGFGGRLELRDVALRPTPDGAPIAALEQVDVDVARFRPATGDLAIRSVAVTRPVLHVRQTASAIEIGAVRLLTPPAGDAPSDAPDAPASASAVAPPALPAAPELRIDSLLITGIDMSLRDERTTPPLLLPLTELDVEVQRFTSRAFSEPRPLSFRAAVGAGPIEFKVRDARTLLGGFLSAAAGAVGGSEAAPTREARNVFDEIALQGKLALFPQPAGWLRLDVSGLELQALAGAAASAGVEIGDGVLDTTVNVRLRGADGLRIDSATNLASLSVTEPPGGPIASYLKLPAPLDSVLYLLRDEEGEIRLPVDVAVGADGMSGGEIARVASTALLRLISDALAAAPMRVMTGALDAAQLGQLPGMSAVPGLGALLGAKPPPLPFDGTPIVVELAPGTAAVPDDLLARLEPVLEQLRADPSLSLVVEHQLGGGDALALARWLQPGEAELRALAGKFSAEHDRLAIERERAAAAARSAWIAAGGAAPAGAAIAELQAIERESAAVDAALDDALALHGDSPRVVAQRVRAAAKLLAQERLDDARERLMGAGVVAIGTRLQVARAKSGPAVGDGGGLLRFTPRRRN